MKYIHLTFGRRVWEIQAYGDGMSNFSGAPYLTKTEARKALRIWRAYTFYHTVSARNVETGETF